MWLDRQRQQQQPKEGRNSGTTSSETPSTSPFVPHKPLCINGIYSDTFYRSWLCRSFALTSSAWLEPDTVPRETVSELTARRFLARYEIPNEPVVLVGASKSWPALTKWRDGSHLAKVTCGHSFRASSGAAPLPANFTLERYVRYCNGAVGEEAPLYLFDRTFCSKCPQLERDYQADLHRDCPMFDPASEHGHDLFGLLGEGRRPDYRWIIIGPKRSGSAFHIDPNATHAWNAPIVGRKRWIFYPPGVNPPGVHPSPSGDDVAMPISIGEWFLTYWDDHVRQRSNPDASKRPLECTVEPGDVLFVPHGWWHTVLNIDEGMNIALTQNYVSCSNLPDVLRFLKHKEQQISGCRDRPESIKPEHLYEKFRGVLHAARPLLLKDAEIVAARGWTCRAWTDDKEESEADSGGECSSRDEKDNGDTQIDKGKKRKILERLVSGTSILQRAKVPKTVSSEGSTHSPVNTGSEKSAATDGVFCFSFV